MKTSVIFPTSHGKDNMNLCTAVPLNNTSQAQFQQIPNNYSNETHQKPHLSGLWVNTPEEYVEGLQDFYLFAIFTSTVTLFLAVLHIIWKKKHRILASKIFICLSISVCISHWPLAAELFNWTESFGHSSCYIMAVISQIGELSVFFWMNIMAYDLWKSTTVLKCHDGIRELDQKRSFVYYNLYGWVFPSVYLGIAVLVDHMDFVPCEYKPGFVEEKNRKCWSISWTNFAGNFLYDICPCSLLIFINTVFLILSYRNIRQTTSVIKNELNQKLKGRFRFYLHLAVIRDLSFILSYIPLWNTGYILIPGILFGINRCFGLFMFILFILNGRIMKSLSSCAFSFSTCIPVKH